MTMTNAINIIASIIQTDIKGGGCIYPTLRPSRFLPHLTHTIIWCVSVPNGMEVDKVADKVADEVTDKVVYNVDNMVAGILDWMTR